MTESRNARGGRQPRRSTRVSQRLQHARERNAAQLAAQREREQRVEDALADFVQAGELITSEDAACAEKVAALQRKIEQTRAASHERVAGEHDRQARAALTIHEAGRNAAQVAELLQLRSEKEARRLIAAGRDATDHDTAQRPQDADASAVRRSDERVGGPEVGTDESDVGSADYTQPRGDDAEHVPDADVAP